ncbi:MAG: hypothetical protein AB2A00_39770 [Myxococcota bacterium]
MLSVTLLRVVPRLALLALVTVVPGAARAAAGPEWIAGVAILPGAGVPASVIPSLRQSVVESVRGSARFVRVLGADELQATLDVDLEAQLAACRDLTCVAKAARALGLDYLVRGELVAPPNAVQLTLTLVHTASARQERAAVRRSQGDLQALREGLDLQVRELLGLSPAPVATAEPASGSPTAAATTTSPPAPTAAPRPESTTETPPGAAGSSPFGVVMRVMGVGVVGLGAVSLVLTVAGALVATGTYAVFHLVPGFDRFRMPMQAVVFVGVGVLAAGVTLAVISALLGGGAAFGSTLVP